MQTMRIALMLLWQPVLLRRTMGKPWIPVLMLALGVGATVLAIQFQAPPAAALACMVGAGLLATWWTLFVISIGLQCGQRGARLVPRLRLIALASTVLVWVCLVLIVTLAVGAVFGHRALWALVAGTGLTAVALVVAGRETLGFVALAALSMVLTRFHEFAQIAAPLATPAGIAVSAALLGASMCYTLRLLLGWHDGGHGQFLALWRQRARGAQTVHGSLLQPFAAMYARCLRQDCARRNRGRLLLHALGPSLHWTGRLSVQLPMLLVNAVFCLVPALNSGQVVGLVAGSVLTSLLLLLKGVARVASGQPEQALLRLAPCMPASKTLNRTLARGLLGLFFTNWIAAMACSAFLLALAGVSRAQFIEVMSAMSASVLLAAAMLRNYALANKRWDRIVLGLLYVLTLVLAFALMTAIPLLPTSMVFGLPTRLATLLPMLLAGLIVAWRLRAMLAAPAAFPAARI
jgi:hypothetical protein